MNKLLRANFSRLFKSILYRICMITTAGMAVFFTLSRYFDIRKRPEYYAEMPADFKCAEGFAFSAALHIVIFAAIFFGSFIGTEYSDGTMRNKILAGHKRYKIYIANFITCAFASTFLMIIEMGCMFLVGKIVFTVSVMSAGKILYYILIECLSMTAFSAILVFFAMMIPNKAAGSVVILILTILNIMAAFWTKDLLDAPKYQSEYVMTGVDDKTGEPVIEYEMWENPGYVSGFKREAYEFMYVFLPTCQLLRIAFNIDEKIPVMIFYSVAICLFMTGIGIFGFGKKDLR